MSLPDDRVLPLLKSDFVVGWTNIGGESYVGQSHGYSSRQCSVATTNGAGARNVQLFVLSSDLVVLHALPGYWHPEDLARELRFALVLDRLWRDDDRTRDQKEAMFERLQRREPRSHPPTTTARSTWQGFDVHYEVARAAREQRDTVVVVPPESCAMPAAPAGETVAAALVAAVPKLRMKPINELVHERMAVRPFVHFAAFDIANFVDYGRPFYDNNMGAGDKGKRLKKPKKKRRR